MGYALDRRWSDFYLPQIRQIVGPFLLEPAPDDIDMHEATDLVILKARDLRIACRVRRDEASAAYPFDFTVRYSRPSGRETEHVKIMAGFGDLMFYGHASSENTIGRWMLIDLDVFRSSLKQDPTYRFIRAKYKGNFDGSSSFYAYDVRSFPDWMVRASSHSIPFDFPSSGAAA